MTRITIASLVLMCLVQQWGCASGRSDANAQLALKAKTVEPGSAYEVTVERKFLDAGAMITTTLSRQGDRERIESRTGFFGASAQGRQPSVSTTIYDFAGHKVYWIGFPGMEALPGGCSWGNYHSARAPVDEDFVTGTAAVLAKMAAGRERRADGASVVGGIAARREVFVGGKPPTDPRDAAAWPVRVFLAEDGGTLLKAEATGPDGKLVPLFEVTRLVLGATVGKPIELPTGCTSGNSEMDDSGYINAHAEVSAEVKVSGSLDAGMPTQ